ncbi:MAG: hypothetical protein OHK0037_03300 [Elainellaceae cyanobacterium]
MIFLHEMNRMSGVRSQGSGIRGQGSGGSLGDANAPTPQHPVTLIPLHLDRFANDDPNVLTLIVIGGRWHVQFHILRLHTLGVVEAGAWSKPLPLPGRAGKVMSLVNRAMA